MPQIELSSYDIRTLEEIIDYAINMKELEEYKPTRSNSFTTKFYDIENWTRVKNILTGKIKKDYMVQKGTYKADISSYEEYYKNKNYREKSDKNG